MSKRTITIDTEAISNAVQDYGQACSDYSQRKPLGPNLEELVRNRARAWHRFLDIIFAEPSSPPPIRPLVIENVLANEPKGRSPLHRSIYANGQAERTVAQHVADAGASARQRSITAPRDGDPVSPCCSARVEMSPDPDGDGEDPVCTACLRKLKLTNEIDIWARGRDQQMRTANATASRVGDHLGAGIDVEG